MIKLLERCRGYYNKKGPFEDSLNDDKGVPKEEEEKTKGMLESLKENLLLFEISLVQGELDS